ncbi:hypothetical protein A3849_28350 [Paenibacillus sp. P46E]|nr:hypothetical protein A3849_28350 [Paenibacillus sp. P46E]
MIGIQFIADTFNMEYKSVAEAIGGSKQTFRTGSKKDGKYLNRVWSNCLSYLGLRIKPCSRRSCFHQKQQSIICIIIRSLTIFMKNKKRERLIEQLEVLVNNEDNEYFKRIEDVVTVFQEQNRNKKTALELVLYYLVHRDNEWEVHPDYAKYERNNSLRRLTRYLRKLELNLNRW